MIQRVLDWWSDKRVLWAEPGVERHFLGCAQCGRLRRYDYLLAPGKDSEFACPKCGHRGVRPHTFPGWRCAWELLIVGYVWRHVIRRHAHQSQWDPRMPLRPVEFEGFK